MPHLADHPRSHEFLERAIAGLSRQTDRDWTLVIVDDASPGALTRERLLRHQAGYEEKIFIVWLNEHRGPGECRNIGVRWADERSSPLVLFHDADDIAHPRRLEVARMLLSPERECDFVYAPVTVIDEDDEPVVRSRLAPSTREIIDSYRNPPEGRDAWIRVGTETGYASVTSTVSVRTEFAVDHPFPSVGFSEDAHTWLRMLAASRDVKCAIETPTQYRVPQGMRHHSHRDRVGPGCNEQKARVDAEGFRAAIDDALARGRIRESQVPRLLAAFYLRLAATMENEGEHDLARTLRRDGGRASLELQVRGASPGSH